MTTVLDRPEMKVRRREENHRSVVMVKGLAVGGDEVIIIAGPCAVEGEEMMLETARQVKACGAHMLRGGAYKPRTSPYSFQGMGEKGLQILHQAGKMTGLPVVTEVMDAQTLDMVAEYADVLQIGARNMQNFSLLRELGQVSKPVILKRGLSATIEEWLLAAEYILNAGNEQVILCERGIRTHEPWTRNTLDLSAAALAREMSHLPVIVDPSHGTGRDNLVTPMARAAVAAGADGIMVEVHPNPREALSDGSQSLTPELFRLLAQEVKQVARAVGRM